MQRVACGLFGMFLCVISSCDSPEPDSLVWSDLPEVRFIPHPAGRFLAGRRIGIDPGHGGLPRGHRPDRGFEGEVNLEVALALQEFLERDGAVVLLTRDSDVDVTLEARPRLVEGQGAEVFISIHHNAVESPEANYTSTWYHRDVDLEPASLDLARRVERRISEALRTPQRVPTPVLADTLMYEKEGFAVLRSAVVPAILCEASFYTHPEEAERLADPEYRRREAYGYYLALVDYFAAGTPTLAFRSFEERKRRDPVLHLELDDGVQSRGGWGSREVRILASSISCRVDSRRQIADYDPKTAVLSLRVPGFRRRARIEVRFQNLFKNSNYPTRFDLLRDSGGEVRLVPASRD